MNWGREGDARAVLAKWLEAFPAQRCPSTYGPNKEYRCEFPIGHEGCVHRALIGRLDAYQWPAEDETKP